jgi:hypothetical protein
MPCFYPLVTKKATRFFITFLSAFYIIPSFAAINARPDNPIANILTKAAVPEIYSVAPLESYIGDSITITGSYFANAQLVVIVETIAGFRVVSDSEIKAAVPPSGINSSVIYVASQEGHGAYYGFNYLGDPPHPLPEISWSPSQSIITGSLVDIYGEHFTGTTAITFGGTPAASFTVIDDSHLQAVVGNGSSGPVTITTLYGSVSGLSLVYIPPSPFIHYFMPVEPHTEGDIITLIGEHLNRTSGILFGGTPAKSFTIANDSTIYAVVDTGSTGVVKLLGIDGSSMQIGGFEYRPYNEMPPRVYSVYPVAAAAGQKVTLKGKHLSSVSLVYLGFGIPHVFTVTSDSTVETTVTPQDTTGSWGYVETPYGGWYFDGFTFLQQPAAPVLDGATPMFAQTGDTVYIRGDSLAYVTNVSFGGVPAISVTITSDSTLTAIIGSGSSGDITITTPGGSASLPGFTYIPAFTTGQAMSNQYHAGISQSTFHVTNNETNASISIYPNPAYGTAWVKHPVSANARIKVINVMGGLVKFVNVAPGAAQTQLSLGGLQPGYYKVTWISGTDMCTSTMIVQ